VSAGGSGAGQGLVTISCSRETAHPPLEDSIIDSWRRCASASFASATLALGTLRRRCSAAARRHALSRDEKSVQGRKPATPQKSGPAGRPKATRAAIQWMQRFCHCTNGSRCKSATLSKGGGGIEFEQKPTHMGKEESLGNAVGIIVRIVDVLVVASVLATP
jgi:hypothetical protein